MSHVEHVADPDRVRRTLDALARHGAAGRARAETGSAPVTLDRVDEDAVVLRCAEPVGAPVGFELHGYNAAFHFVALDAAWRDGELRAPLPPAFLRVRRRWLKRHAVPGQLMAWHARTGGGR